MQNSYSENIDYKTTNPNIEEYWSLFNSTGWNVDYKFSIEELLTAIERSWYSISAYSEDRLIGYGRIISDGIHHAFIIDLIVSPSCQGNGIGSELLKKLIQKCTQHNIRDIQLFSAKNKFEFYEKYGFQKRLEDSPGMQFVYK
jgi:ribosomal protein S18 acetylase RimI-like enzyme